MILNDKQITVAYRCPDCGMWVTGIVGMFSLTADMLRLKCPCGKSEATMVHTAEKKIRLTVPCFLCPQAHHYTVSSAMFFERDIFALPCAYSGIDICFIGAEDKVSSATDASDKELLEILGENNYSDFSKTREAADSPFLSDPQILDIVNFVIRDLDESGQIKCKCDEDEGYYFVDVTDEGIVVKCENCGAKALIPVSSTITANAFLNCDHLELE
ncbi:MAG: hypothetical protein IKL36_03075 [Clostridia bacterium]|nr:hypothetical protein [Clostridia bacterium]